MTTASGYYSMSPSGWAVWHIVTPRPDGWEQRWLRAWTGGSPFWLALAMHYHMTPNDLIGSPWCGRPAFLLLGQCMDALEFA